MYGPPVPTYGSVPGMFGGADQRLSNFPNIYIQNGRGTSASVAPEPGGGGPRRRRSMPVESNVGTPCATNGQAMIDVRLQTPDAEVFFEGNNTRQAGVRRMFQSPTVQIGTTYYYKIFAARWKQPDGTIADQERSVGVRANETSVVEFGPAKPIEDKPLIAAN